MFVNLGVADAGDAVRPGARLVHPRAPGLAIVVHHLGTVLSYKCCRNWFEQMIYGVLADTFINFAMSLGPVISISANPKAPKLDPPHWSMTLDTFYDWF